MKKSSVLVIGNVFESTSLIVKEFCELDNEVVAEKLSSRISGAAIVVSATAAYLNLQATIITKAKENGKFCNLAKKLSSIGVETNRINYTVTESNTLITVYNSQHDRRCYSFLPAQLTSNDLTNIDYSLFDAVFFCCLPYDVVSPVFQANTTIHFTKSVIVASAYTPDYFVNQEIRVPANYIFCNRGELLNILGVKREKIEYLTESQLSRVHIGGGILIITMGKDGIIVFDGEVTKKYDVPRVDNIVHPGGAGDAFATGFISGVLENVSVEKCCSIGHSCATKMLSVYNVESFVDRIIEG